MAATKPADIYINEPALTAEEVRKARRDDTVKPAPRPRDED